MMLNIIPHQLFQKHISMEFSEQCLTHYFRKKTVRRNIWRNHKLTAQHAYGIS